MAGPVQSTSTRLLGAGIRITSPAGAVVGPNFVAAGTASVRMRITIGGVQAGQFDVPVTEGFRVTLRYGGADHAATVVPAGDDLNWSHRVQDASGRLDITAELDGRVTETSFSPVTGTHSESRDVHRTVTRQFIVDSGGPQLSVTGQQVTVQPPFQATLTGAARDEEAGVQSVRWEAGGSSGPAENLSGDWASWRAVVPLPDRRSAHEIVLRATDRVGQTTSLSITIPAETAPVIGRTQPPDNPHRVLWRDGGITVSLQGVAVDPEGNVAAVHWRLDGGATSEAEQTSAKWLTWRADIPISSPGPHVVEFWATDTADNESGHDTLQINVQVEG